jgi:hypothetical protein
VPAWRTTRSPLQRADGGGGGAAGAVVRCPAYLPDLPGHQWGADVIVSAWAGHADLSFTKRNYVHPSASDDTRSRSAPHILAPGSRSGKGVATADPKQIRPRPGPDRPAAC